MRRPTKVTEHALSLGLLALSGCAASRPRPTSDVLIERPPAEIASPPRPTPHDDVTPAVDRSVDSAVSPVPVADDVEVPGGMAVATVKTPPSAPPVDVPRAKLIGALPRCAFPPDVGDEVVDSARVTLLVEVSADGGPKAVRVVSDPGSGFGRAARQCVLRLKFEAGRDEGGHPVPSSLVLMIRFER